MNSPSLTLVTGATGFVGAAVVRALLKRGVSVRVLSRPHNDRRNLAGLTVEIAEGDLTDHASLVRALKGCEALYHVAADYRIWVPDPVAMDKVNVVGTLALMEAALVAGVRRIVYTSSVATLGYAADGSPADEDTPSTLETMIGAYKRSKFRAEEEVRRMVQERALPCIIVNPAAPIGPRDIKPTPTGRMIVDAMHGKMPAFIDTGLNVVHVDDVAEGHLLAFEKGEVGRRYVLGGENLHLREILRHVAEATNQKPPTLALPIKPLYALAVLAETVSRVTRQEPMITIDALRMAEHKMYFSSKRAATELGYRPRPAKAAIMDAVAWFRDNSY